MYKENYNNTTPKKFSTAKPIIYHYIVDEAPVFHWTKMPGMYRPNLRVLDQILNEYCLCSKKDLQNQKFGAVV